MFLFINLYFPITVEMNIHIIIHHQRISKDCYESDSVIFLFPLYVTNNLYRKKLLGLLKAFIYCLFFFQYLSNCDFMNITVSFC